MVTGRMTDPAELNKLIADLEKCLGQADGMGLGMAGIYISHALEHLEYIESMQPPNSNVTKLKTGRSDNG